MKVKTNGHQTVEDEQVRRLREEVSSLRHELEQLRLTTRPKATSFDLPHAAWSIAWADVLRAPSSAASLSPQLDMMPQGVGLLDDRGRIVFANVALCRWLGHPPSFMSRPPLADFVPNEIVRPLGSSLSQMLQGDASIQQLWLGPPDLPGQQVRLSLCPVLDHGRVMGASLMLDGPAFSKPAGANDLDLSVASTALMAKVTNAIPGVVYQYQLSHTGIDSFPFVGGDCDNLYEMPAEQYASSIAVGWSLIIPEDRHWMKLAIEQSARQQSVFRCTWRIRTPSGALKWISGHSVPRRLNHGNVVWNGVFNDVTDVVQLGPSSPVEQSKPMHYHIADGMTHHINNLLTGIMGQVGLMGMDLSPGSELHQPLAEIEKATFRASESCRELLAWSGNRVRPTEDHEIGSLVKIFESVIHGLAGDNVQVRFDLNDAKTPILVDTKAFEHLLTELVTNAVEAMGTAGGTLTLRTQLADETEGLQSTPIHPDGILKSQVSLDIVDTGMGFSPTIHHRLMDPFFTTKDVGRGLGLAKAQGIMRAHNGSINIQGMLGQGSMVRLVFPVDRLRPDRLGLAGPSFSIGLEDRLAPAQSQRPEVLLVENPDDEFSGSGNVIDRLRVFVRSVADGEEALGLVGHEPDRFAAVLLDWGLANIDGFEVFHRLRAINARLPIFVLCADRRSEGLARLSEQDRACCLSKPLVAREVISQFERIGITV